MAENSGADLDPHVLAAITAAIAASAPKVTYDVADLLDRMGTRIDSGFATMNERLTNTASKSDLAAVDRKLDTKAEKADLAPINERLEQHGREIGGIKDRLREDEAAEKALEQARVARRSMREWSVSTWVAIAGVMSSAGFLVYTVLH